MKNKIIYKKILNYFKKNINILNSISNVSDSSIDFESSILDKLIVLLPHNKVNHYPTPVHLAAASIELRPHDTAHSYIDLNNEYLIRIIEKEDRNLLYLITENELPKKVKIKFFPSGNEYFIKENIQPIEILKEKVIEKIVIL